VRVPAQADARARGGPRRLVADLLLHRLGAAAAARYGDVRLVGEVPALLGNVAWVLDQLQARARATGALPLLEHLGLISPPPPAPTNPAPPPPNQSDAERALAACAADDAAAAELRRALSSLLALPPTSDPAAAAAATLALWRWPGGAAEARDVAAAAAAALRADRIALCCERRGQAVALAPPSPPSGAPLPAAAD
jgi:predicted deacylase